MYSTLYKKKQHIYLTCDIQVEMGTTVTDRQ